MQGEKEYLVLFELQFCNLRFKFRFLDAHLGIESELIIVSNFLHLRRVQTSQQWLPSWPLEIISKESAELYSAVL